MDVFVISDICQVEEAWRINLKRFNDLIYVANLCVGIALSLSLSLSLFLSLSLLHSPNIVGTVTYLLLSHTPLRDL